jgi:prepilin-type N-terminal cleavage/methylation domain-containing protein
MRQRGFTLVETMLVMVVVGIVLAFGLPSFRNYRLTLVRQQAREQLLQDLRAARQVAITRHTPVIVSFKNVGTINSNYTIHHDRNNDKVIQNTELRSLRRMPRDARVLSVTLTPNDSLLFDTSGILRLGTTGGRIVTQTTNGKRDTLYVSMAGIAYRQ